MLDEYLCHTFNIENVRNNSHSETISPISSTMGNDDFIE